MTGLDPDTDVIIEIYCLITTADLALVDAGGFGVVVHQPAAVMAAMGEWCTRTHGASGLTAAVAASTTSPADAAAQLLAYIRRHVPAPGAGILAGNSIHADRSFLRRPPYNVVTDHLHYRLLDVSSIKEAARRWSPRAIKKLPSKKGLHKARDDILESIAEASFYREMIFQIGEEAAVARAAKNRKHKK